MEYEVYNEESAVHLGTYSASCLRAAKFVMYEDAGYEPHEVTESMLEEVTATPVPLTDNEGRMNAR